VIYKQVSFVFRIIAHLSIIIIIANADAQHRSADKQFAYVEARKMRRNNYDERRTESEAKQEGIILQART